MQYSFWMPSATVSDWMSTAGRQSWRKRPMGFILFPPLSSGREAPERKLRDVLTFTHLLPLERLDLGRLSQESGFTER
jgi:hypothetical protein